MEVFHIAKYAGVVAKHGFHYIHINLRSFKQICTCCNNFVFQIHNRLLLKILLVLNFGLYLKPKRNADGNQASRSSQRGKKRNQAGGGGKLRRIVEREKECMPEERACSVWLGEQRQGGSRGGEGALVAAPKTFGGRHLQFFIEGSSALVPKPSPHWGYREEAFMLNLGGECPQDGSGDTCHQQGSSGP